MAGSSQLPVSGGSLVKVARTFLVAGLLLGVVSSGHAQVQYVGKEWGEVPVPGLVGRTVHVYKHPDESDKLILTPFYCMRANKEGKLLTAEGHAGCGRKKNPENLTAEEQQQLSGLKERFPRLKQLVEQRE